MPVIKSAIKKLRKDKKRTAANDEFRGMMELAIRRASRSKNPENISAAFALIDKGVKKHLIHANRAARMKSRLSGSGGKSAVALESKPEKAKKTTSQKKPTKSKTAKSTPKAASL